ncbi:GNAT family N-acetyltransferase [Polynucleobacter corsicus]|uniref:GNAT family N-acetyltransferase n=1 Tax=Polynucleobacter corsicus TaxID=2081042 RepID=UPI00203F7872|nr:GNAT family N-acetyltransferase [Polynucleobacter corsicus]QWE17944.1 GNAT family N-acetyltransferase [Polynucleobacter corsicus]
MAHSQTPIVILMKTWQDAKLDAYSIRSRVFIEEQGVPEEMELDEFDLDARHALAYADSECIGTARLVTLAGNIGRIGRMAVLLGYRGQGVAKQLLGALLKASQSQGIKEIELHAQVTVIPFYEQFGFIAQGDVYDEAGIPHRDMILRI